MDQSWIELEAGSFMMGTDDQEGFERDKEGPAQQVELAPFAISKFTITNRQFQDFFLETAYVTDAERFGSSHVFHLLLDSKQKEKARALEGTNWWYEVAGACWRKPEGDASSIQDRMDHPVVHVSWNDAHAYCQWAGVRLPSEAEWEYAARGGVEGQTFPWGNDFKLDGQYQANTFQGDFPNHNTAEDGYLATAPVDSYPPNGYGLYQMIGNVWEWCLNPAYIDLKDFQTQSSADFMRTQSYPSQDSKALRGGSFLCHPSYCKRYRTAGRNGNTALSSTSNAGFRVAQSL